MPDATLRLELDRDPPRYRPGEPITGTLRLAAHSDTECRGVWMRPACVVVGGGNPFRDAFERVVISEETRSLRSGEELRWPFEMTVPAGPPTREGKLVSVEWKVQAFADLPGWPGLQDAAVSEPFVLRDTVPGTAPEEEEPDEIRVVRPISLSRDEAERLRAMPEVPWAPPHRSTQRFLDSMRRPGCVGRGCAVVNGCTLLPLVGAPFAFLFYGLYMLVQGEPLGVLPLGFGVVVLAILVFLTDRMFGGALRRGVSRLFFGGFRLAAPLERPRRGERLEWAVRVTPRRRVTLRRARAAVEVRELKYESLGSGRYRTVAHVHGTRRSSLDEAIELPPGEEAFVTGAITLPASWPAAACDDHGFCWTLEVGLELEGGPDWSRKVPLDVA